MSEQTRPVTEEQEIKFGNHIVRLHKQRVEIRDLEFGALIILKAEEAEQLRQWLAEVL